MSPYIVPGFKFKKDIVMKYNQNQSSEQKMDTIVNAVCLVMDVGKGKVLSKSRKREFVTARQLSMYFIRMRYPKIGVVNTGLYFRRDHTTVTHSLQMVNNLIETNHRETRELITVLNEVL